MNDKQLVVRCNDETIAWLEEHGYTNIQNLTTQNYTFPVVVVDIETRKFFGTNTTCMAAMKPKIIEF